MCNTPSTCVPPPPPPPCAVLHLLPRPPQADPQAREPELGRTHLEVLDPPETHQCCSHLGFGSSGWASAPAFGATPPRLCAPRLRRVCIAVPILTPCAVAHDFLSLYTRRGSRLCLQMCPRFAFIWGVRRWPLLQTIAKAKTGRGVVRPRTPSHVGLTKRFWSQCAVSAMTQCH